MTPGLVDQAKRLLAESAGVVPDSAYDCVPTAWLWSARDRFVKDFGVSVGRWSSSRPA